MLSMVIVAAVALGAATYAWFTFVSNPEVRNINLHVRAAENIFMSPYPGMDTMDADYFFNENKWFPVIQMYDGKGTLNADDGETYYNGIKDHQKAAFPADLNDVSSIFTTGTNGRDFYGRVNADTGEFKEYVKLKDRDDFDDNAANAKDYVKFDLWMKSSADGRVYLDGTSDSGAVQTFIKAMTEDWKEEYGELDDDVKQLIVSTVRVGFYWEEDNAGGGSGAVIWEPFSTTHVPSNYGGPGTAKLKLPTTAIAQAGGPSVFPNGVHPSGLPIQTTFDFGVETNNSKTEKDTIDLFFLKATDGDLVKPVKFSVYIWIEGADADTVNAVAKSFFTTQLRFAQDNEVFKSSTGGGETGGGETDPPDEPVDP